MKALLLALVTACWANPPAPTLRIVYRPKYIHDIPRDCKGLPAFPSIVILDQPGYVEAIDHWLYIAGMCLNARTYPIAPLLEVRKW